MMMMMRMTMRMTMMSTAAATIKTVCQWPRFFSPHQLHVVHLLQFQFLPWTLFLFADFDFPFGFPFLACYAPGKHAKIQIIFYCLNSINGGAGKALEIKITRDCLRFHSVLRALQLHDVSECISIPNLYLNLKRSWQLLLWGSSNESEAR